MPESQRLRVFYIARRVRKRGGGVGGFVAPTHSKTANEWGTRAASKVPVNIAGIYGIFGSQVQRDKVDHPKFIDLFCGIGGMRLAFESAGAECVFSSDWDKYAQQTYAANFGDTPAGNIREIKACDIPDHDILVGGFPCQPFSISGVSKRNGLGREHGFKGDEALR